MKQDQTSHGIGLLRGYENIEQYTGTVFFHLDGSVENIQSLVLKSKIHEVTQHLWVAVIQIGLKKKDLVRFLHVIRERIRYLTEHRSQHIGTARNISPPQPIAHFFSDQALHQTKGLRELCQ